jgi:hypothetical protein
MADRGYVDARAARRLGRLLLTLIDLAWPAAVRV